MLKDQRLTLKGLCSIGAEVKGARSMAVELHTRESLAFPLAGGLASAEMNSMASVAAIRLLRLLTCCLLFWVHERSKRSISGTS